MIIGSSWGKFLNNNIIIVSQRMQLIQCSTSWHIAHASALNLSISILLSVRLPFARFIRGSPLCAEDSRLALVYVFEFPIVANIYSQDRCRAFSCFQPFKLVLAPFLIPSSNGAANEAEAKGVRVTLTMTWCALNAALLRAQTTDTLTFIAFITRLIYNLKSEEK